MATVAPEILLAEAEPILADITAFRLELLGFKMRIAGSLDAVQIALSERLPDLLLLDTEMPDGNGVQFVTQLRGQWNPHQLSILVFSIDSSLETVQRAYLAGAQDYLVTPFDPTILEEKIQNLLEARASLGKR
jgi:DNA-binding response OmpR family regulator